ncbi:hypothetical protein MC885_014388 [Smutsia gigantea]|nr:hypothetical protein MC885_014388 [Smutsia gigantea]
MEAATAVWRDVARNIGGSARVAAGRYPALGARLATRFFQQRTPGVGMSLQQGLHATAPRAVPLIPIVVEQTVWRRRGHSPEQGPGARPDPGLQPHLSSPDAYDIYSRLLRERIMCIMGPVSAPHRCGPCTPLRLEPLHPLTSLPRLSN